MKASQEELAWFQQARFGMFVHWGPVSLTGHELSWSRLGPRPYDHQGGGKTPAAEYDLLFRKFNPVDFDANAWVQLAKEAGMRYLVFTSKHHDGFSNFHTRVSDHSIEHTPYRKDIVAQLAAACHTGGLRFGIYYSQRDWYHPDYLNERQEQYVEFMHEQIRELLTNYGKVDVLWFDSIGKDLNSWRSRQLLQLAHQLQPGIVVNNRAASVLGDYLGVPEQLNGDFDTPEEKIGNFQNDRPWESCLTLVGKQWSWKPGGEMMSLRECLHALSRCAGGDGNLLLNVGPMPSGQIEPRQAQRLREIGAWLEKHGEAVYGTRGGPFLPAAWGVSTHSRDAIYLHVLDPKSPITLPAPYPDSILSAEILNGTAVPFREENHHLIFSLPLENCDPNVTIVRLRPRHYVRPQQLFADHP